MKHALSAAVALALGIGLAVTAQAHGTFNRQNAVPGTDMQAGASAPIRHAAATRHMQSRQHIMRTQRMLKAQGLYTGRIDGVMNQRTQMALTRLQIQQKGTHRVAVVQQRQQKSSNRAGTLHKTPRPVATDQAAGVGSSAIPPTAIIPPKTEAPNAGGNTDQNTKN